MDDVLAINIQKTELREAYNEGDPQRLLAILDDDFIRYADKQKSGYGAGGRQALRVYLEQLFAKYDAKLVPIIIEIKLMGDAAVEYGWHELSLTPKSSGDPEYMRTRYVSVWKRQTDGSWKLAVFIDNADVPDTMVKAPD